MNTLTLSPIFQSGMVLQREKPILVFGTAPEGSLVTVHLFSESADCTSSTAVSSDCNVTKAALSQANVTPSHCTDCAWQCVLSPQKAGEHFSLSVSCSVQTPDQDILLTDISIGDVWLAGGQSNMEFFLRYDQDWETVKAYEPNPKIHMYNVPQLAFPGHQKDTTGYGKWFREGESGFEIFSAPGYSFARNLQPHIGVPIGIIGCNWGGTTASAWLDEKLLEDSPLSVYLEEYEAALRQYAPEELEQLSLQAWAFEDSKQHTEDFMPLLYGRDRAWQEQYMQDHKDDPKVPLGPWNINRPGGLYHKMLEPLIPFTLKGFLWYQGESDCCHASLYGDLMSSLISCWRTRWNDELPFLFVQLAPFGLWLDCDSIDYAEVRHQQEWVSKTVPQTGMISIMDIGSYYDIHPKQKMEVGRRLALLARSRVYGESIVCESPSLLRAERNGKTLLFTLSDCQELHGCLPYGTPPLPQPPVPLNGKPLPTFGTPTGFVLLQEQKEIPIDSIRLQDNQILITADTLSSAPCSVSFAWADFAEVHIWNEAGLPVRPFRCEV